MRPALIEVVHYHQSWTSNMAIALQGVGSLREHGVPVEAQGRQQ